MLVYTERYLDLEISVIRRCTAQNASTSAKWATFIPRDTCKPINYFSSICYTSVGKSYLCTVLILIANITHVLENNIGILWKS